MSYTKKQALDLAVGQNCAVLVRMAGRYGGATVLPEGQVGELLDPTDGETHIAWIIPESLKEQVGKGFGGATTRRYNFRAVIEDGDRKVLVSGSIGKYQTLANIKRIVDRPNPLAREAPREAYGHPQAKPVRDRRRADYYMHYGIDYEDTEEL